MRWCLPFERLCDPEDGSSYVPVAVRKSTTRLRSQLSTTTISASPRVSSVPPSRKETVGGGSPSSKGSTWLASAESTPALGSNSPVSRVATHRSSPSSAQELQQQRQPPQRPARSPEPSEKRQNAQPLGLYIPEDAPQSNDPPPSLPMRHPARLAQNRARHQGSLNSLRTIYSQQPGYTSLGYQPMAERVMVPQEMPSPELPHSTSGLSGTTYASMAPVELPGEDPAFMARFEEKEVLNDATSPVSPLLRSPDSMDTFAAAPQVAYPQVHEVTHAMELPGSTPVRVERQNPNRVSELVGDAPELAEADAGPIPPAPPAELPVSSGR